MRPSTVSDAARELGISARRVRQLAALHPQVIAGERPLRVDVSALREIRGGSPGATAAAALHVIEFTWPKIADEHRTVEVFTLLLIDQLHPELRSASRYPEPLRRLRARAGLPADPGRS
jgi:hypothetical protein